MRRWWYLSVSTKPPSFITGTFLTALMSPNSSVYCCPETKNTGVGLFVLPWEQACNALMEEEMNSRGM